MAVAREIIDKSGAWYAYGSTKLGQGRENAKIFLSENEEICAEIEQKIREFKEPEKPAKGRAKAPKGKLAPTLSQEADTDILNDTDDDMDEQIDYLVEDGETDED